jgi:hypothetical protein
MNVCQAMPACQEVQTVAIVRAFVQSLRQPSRAVAGLGAAVLIALVPIAAAAQNAPDTSTIVFTVDVAEIGEQKQAFLGFNASGGGVNLRVTVTLERVTH